VRNKRVPFLIDLLAVYILDTASWGNLISNFAISFFFSPPLNLWRPAGPAAGDRHVVFLSQFPYLIFCRSDSNEQKRIDGMRRQWLTTNLSVNDIFLFILELNFCQIPFFLFLFGCVSCRMFCPFWLVVISAGWPLKRHTESFGVLSFHSSALLAVIILPILGFFFFFFFPLGCCCRYEDSIRWAMIYYHLIWE
jgi:hypothetical protein